MRWDGMGCCDRKKGGVEELDPGLNAGLWVEAAVAGFLEGEYVAVTAPELLENSICASPSESELNDAVVVDGGVDGIERMGCSAVLAVVGSQLRHRVVAWRCVCAVLGVLERLSGL
jgi:hypothetical protein